MTVHRSQPNSIEYRLRSWTVDWDGSPMKDGEPPRDGLICKDLRDGSDEIAALNARITELESAEKARIEAYEAILGPRTYNEVAEHIRGLERALQWIVNSPSAHPGNMVKVAEDGLSHAGPVARDGER